MRNKSLVLFGYWAKNLGDDLFLDILDKHYPNTKKYILVSKKYKSYYKSKKIKPIANDSLLYRVLNKACSYFKLPELYYLLLSNKRNIFVILGGSMFIESESWKKKYIDLSYAVSKCSDSVLMGSNFGSFFSNDYYNKYKLLFSKMGSCSFRDKKSCSLFPCMPNIEYAPDLILTLNTSDFSLQNPKEDYFVVSIINLENRKSLSSYKEIYENKISEIVCEIINRGFKVKLMSFCESEGDFDAVLRISALVENKSKKADMVKYNGVKNSLKVISQSKGIVATRFHAMILAFLFNIPVYPVCYSEKMTDVIKDYSFQNSYISINNLDACNPESVFLQLLNKPCISGEVIDKANGHFKYLNSII